jgi:asparagine synthetase B (glutamine-hydrolysing)
VIVDPAENSKAYSHRGPASKGIVTLPQASDDLVGQKRLVIFDPVRCRAAVIDAL